MLLSFLEARWRRVLEAEEFITLWFHHSEAGFWNDFPHCIIAKLGTLIRLGFHTKYVINFFRQTMCNGFFASYISKKSYTFEVVRNLVDT